MKPPDTPERAADDLAPVSPAAKSCPHVPSSPVAAGQGESPSLPLLGLETTAAERGPSVPELAWHVYRFYNADNRLLYVGYTRWLKRRIGVHRREKPWWPEVVTTKVDDFSTEDDARLCEKTIWETENPAYNRNSPFVAPGEPRTRWRSPESRARMNAAKRIANMSPEKADQERARKRAQGRRRDYRMLSLTPEQRERERKRNQRRRIEGRHSQVRQLGEGLF